MYFIVFLKKDFFSYTHLTGGQPKLKLYQNYLIFHHSEALNERISEWAYFLNLAKQFRSYLNFSTPENGVF